MVDFGCGEIWQSETRVSIPLTVGERLLTFCGSSLPRSRVWDMVTSGS